MRFEPANLGFRLSARTLSCLAALGIAATLCAQAPNTPSAPAPRLLDASAARAVGFLPGWQTRLPILEGGALKGVHYQGSEGKESEGSLFAWDDDGVIMKIDPATGDLRWHSASVSAKGNHGLLDVNAAGTSTTSLVVGLGDISCLTLDSRTGIELGQTRYPHIPVTRSIRSGTDLVFGSRGGHLVWLGFRDERVPSRLEARAGDAARKETAVVAAVHTFAFEERAHQLKGSVQADPVAAGDAIVACSTSGEVACFGQVSRNRRWQVNLPGGVVATPATDGRNVYVACRDQYLRCIELAKGQTRWKWFCESPLENPPLLAGDLVMLQVPDMGLVALEAGASGSRTREPKWKSNARGNPITRIPEGIVVWDATSSTLSLVDDTTGIVRESRTMQGIQQVRASGPIGGDLYLMSTDGRLQRCPPASPMPTAAAEAPAPSEPTPAETPASDSPEASEASANEAAPAAEPAADPSGT